MTVVALPEQIIIGLTLTVAVGSITVTVTLLVCAFIQLGMSELATLTILIVVLLVNVLLIVPVPDPFSIIVWFEPPLTVYVTVAFGVPVKVIVVAFPEQIVDGETPTEAAGKGLIVIVTVDATEGHWVRNSISKNVRTSR